MNNKSYSDYIRRFSCFVEKINVSILILMMSVLLLYTTYQLALHLIESLFIQGNSFDIDSTMELFGGLLLVLIGIELLDTIKIYLKDNIIHVEVVILVAIIALARKIIILKVEDYSGAVIIGIGVLILALTGAYYLIRKAELMTIVPDNNPEDGTPDK